MLLHVTALPDATCGAIGVTPAVATSVPNDRTRSAWPGGVKSGPEPSVGPGVPNQVVPIGAWGGLGTRCGALPRPPPSWPTMTSEVGICCPAPVPKLRLLVRLIVSVVPAVTRITGGAQVAENPAWYCATVPKVVQVTPPSVVVAPGAALNVGAVVPLVPAA